MKKPINDTLGYIFILLYFVGVIGFIGGFIISSPHLIIICGSMLLIDFILCNKWLWDKMVQRHGNVPNKFPTHLITKTSRPLWFDILLNIGLAIMIGFFIKYLN